MHYKWVFNHFQTRSRRPINTLATLWILGLLIGILLSCLAPYDFAEVFRLAFVSKPAPLQLLFVCVLPVAVAAIALSSSLFVFSYIAVFFCAVSHGFCGIAIYAMFGSAAWLLRPILLFSAGCSSVLMWWLFLQNETKSRLHSNIRIVGILSCLIFFIDLFIVSPFIGDLAKYF